MRTRPLTVSISSMKTATGSRIAGSPSALSMTSDHFGPGAAPWPGLRGRCAAASTPLSSRDRVVGARCTPAALSRLEYHFRAEPCAARVPLWSRGEQRRSTLRVPAKSGGTGRHCGRGEVRLLMFKAGYARHCRARVLFGAYRARIGPKRAETVQDVPANEAADEPAIERLLARRPVSRQGRPAWQPQWLVGSDHVIPDVCQVARIRAAWRRVRAVVALATVRAHGLPRLAEPENASLGPQ